MDNLNQFLRMRVITLFIGESLNATNYCCHKPHHADMKVAIRPVAVVELLRNAHVESTARARCRPSGSDSLKILVVTACLYKRTKVTQPQRWRCAPNWILTSRAAWGVGEVHRPREAVYGGGPTWGTLACPREESGECCLEPLMKTTR